MNYPIKLGLLTSAFSILILNFLNMYFAYSVPLGDEYKAIGSLVIITAINTVAILMLLAVISTLIKREK